MIPQIHTTLTPMDSTDEPTHEVDEDGARHIGDCPPPPADEPELDEAA